MHKPEKHLESGRKEVTATSTRTYSHVAVGPGHRSPPAAFINPIHKLRLLFFYLTCRDCEAQSHCGYLIFLSRFLSHGFRPVFSEPPGYH
jgi:hypothetical protein